MSPAVWYLLAVNVLTFFLFAADKYKAVHHQWRIRESVLLLAAFLGGAAGGLLAMGLCHHKTKKLKFYMGLPLMLAAQMIVAAYFRQV